MPKPMAAPRTPFEARLRKHMAHMKIETYKDLVELSGVSRATIDNACRGYHTLSYASATKIASALGITIDTLMT